MADIFISYAREDRSRAEQVARSLAAMGFDVFWDIDIPPGRTWADYTEEKLAASKAMIVLWTETSTKSQWVREEARMGRDRGTLIPVMLDGSPAPFGFGEVQAANLSTWRGEANHPDWVRFANAVDAAVRGPNAAPRPVPQAAASAGAGWRSAEPQAAAWQGEAAPEQLSPVGYIAKCFRLYANAKGRARRSEYWWWVLFVTAVTVVAMILDAVIFGWNPATNAANTQAFYGIASLALFLPGLCVLIRRFHDVGLSGWLAAGFFAAAIVGGALTVAAPPVGGLIILAVLAGMLIIVLLPSKPGPNAYGPNPKGQ